MIKILLIFLLSISGCLSQNGNKNRPSLNQNQQGSCLSGSCSPENGNLLIGRKSMLFASSTCGEKQPERYCVLGATLNATQCYVCDSRHHNDTSSNIFSHIVSNIVSTDPSKSKERWWQSENGVQDVYIQFDLEAEFLFTHMIMTFKTIRPAAMVIEKSSDFAFTWKPIGYFAQNCRDSFPGIPTRQINLGDVYCENKYSSEMPTTNGQVIFRMLPPHLTIDKNPNSPEIQELLKITNLRFNFTKMHTFGDTLLDGRDELKEKYYYALYELVARGSCLCYGHANKCIRTPDVAYDDDAKGMIHGYCQCTHNTDGNNCERCLPLYNDRPWTPARNNEKNECKKCECNNHAQSCHFNETLFNQSGEVSGGICDFCQHNTEGRFCELCIGNHYRDPQRSKEDPFTCRPCQCQAKGTTNDGKCDPRTDETAGLVAGKCHCKENVDGVHCDRCKNGFFNLTAQNPQGCESCLCNIIGTTGNLGCDKVSGSCSCKIFVTGRACDQCAAGFFGLSQEDPNGCKACDCYPGGSVGTSCDAISGQCTCKPNMTGRKCDTPIDDHFCPSLTYLTYDAEDAQKTNPERTKEVFRQIYPDRKATWGGPGFVRLYEGGGLEFVVTSKDILTSANYELVVRYEQNSEVQSRIRVTVTNIDLYPDPLGPCANSNSNNVLSASFSSNQIHHILTPSVCFEAGKSYKIHVELSSLQMSSSRDNSVLIDSIVIVPIIESLPEFKNGGNQRLLEDFNYYRCKETQLSLYEYEPHEMCKKYMCAIALSAFSSMQCNCNPTGSTSGECDRFGGFCKCKTNVVGQKCDQCAASTWGFGPNGCQACNCHPVASKDNFCDVNSGMCSCYDNIEGQKCDSCKKGFWYFPQCIPCTCNGNADSCDQSTGTCFKCRDNSDGNYCERCKEGYYGDPANNIPCRECMCPGGHGANQFSKSCFSDARQEQVVCSCEEGYDGASCNRCSVNYYGNPTEVGGSCKKCQCNGNVNENDRRSCDEVTGKCSNCLYNTAGDYCNVCAPGFYGDAATQDCKPCYCNTEGTRGHLTDNCNALTGQCACLPNVIGRQCDECKANHFGISSGKGCTDCDCDSDGTHKSETSCNLETGQCDCLPSRGGLTCSECSHGYWGDPTQDNCKKCECNPNGSLDIQCDKLTGQCSCKRGITGYHCDRCDRGTYGQIPECRQCGECFDNWSGILAGIKNQIDNLENQATNIAVSSVASVEGFSERYADLEGKLNDIKKLLNLNHTDRQIKLLHDSLYHIEKQIAIKKESKEKFYNVEHWVDPTSRLNQLKEDFADSDKKAQEIYEKVNSLIDSSNRGSKWNIEQTIEKSKNQSKKLNILETKAENELKPSSKQMLNEIEMAKTNLDKYEKEKKEVIQNTLNQISNSFKSVSNLNAAVCGADTSESKLCDSLCGGAGCKHCGSNSSSCSGLADAHLNLVSIKQKFEDLYTSIEVSLKKILMKWRNVNLNLNNSNKESKMIEELAQKALMILNNKRDDVKNLTENINKFYENFTNTVEKINEEIELINKLEVKRTDAELDAILEEISKLDGTVNLDTLQKETTGANTNAKQLLNGVDSVAAHSAGIGKDIDRLVASLEKKLKTIDENESDVKKLTIENSKTKESIEKSTKNLDTVSKTVAKIQKTVDDLKTTVDSDKDKNYPNKQEDLKSTLKVSSITLDKTKELLRQLDEKLGDITKRLPKAESSNMDVNTLLNHLTNLKTTINQKEKEIDERNSRIEALENTYNDSKVKYEKLRLQVDSLKLKTVKLKDDIYNKLNFFSTCN